VVARRLNHAEYNNTVRDLLGTQLTPANDFPADDLGDGFDTVGSALSLSPAYVAAYERAAHTLAADLFRDATRRAKTITCDVEREGDGCARAVLMAFARRAWRRPVTQEEVDPLLLPLTTARRLGATALEGLQYSFAAALMSPHFLFKLEPAVARPAPQRLSPHQIATRLSYALWSTMPDEPLFKAADAGELNSESQIAAQIDRMLADARSEALLDTFAAQWLDYANLPAQEVERTAYPRYTPALARSMQLEARQFIRQFLRSPVPVEDMLTARFTFVDAPLARHYGLPAPSGSADGLSRVDTANVPRTGLLTLGAFLMTTSFSARTSPVKRGDFVFSRLLCGHIPPPPPDVPALADGLDSRSLRQRLEEHRKNPTCASCHKVMDPIGFGLEQYDAIGAYRTQEGSTNIDASGTLPDGTSFDGALELSRVLARDPRFPLCVTRKFLTFATGRLFAGAVDEAWIEHLTTRAQRSNGSFGAIIREVLLSDVFLAGA
jgi:hypothetical protein